MYNIWLAATRSRSFDVDMIKCVFAIFSIAVQNYNFFSTYTNLSSTFVPNTLLTVPNSNPSYSFSTIYYHTSHKIVSSFSTNRCSFHSRLLYNLKKNLPMSPKSSNFAGEMKIGVFDSGYGGLWVPAALRPLSAPAPRPPTSPPPPEQSFLLGSLQNKSVSLF